MGLACMIRFFSLVSLCCAAFFSSTGLVDEPKAATPLVIGETFLLESKVLGETRRINVYLPAGYSESADLQFPVLYMPDGGLKEDFLHIAGLVQVLVGNGTMRPHVLVGIENTVRRRDLAGPTEVEDEKKMSPQAGGANNFRRFIREELKPEIAKRYRITKESAIVGESLAGLFAVETFLVEPELFDTYIAIDPSVWWNNQTLVKGVAKHLKEHPRTHKTLYLARSEEKENESIMRRLVEDVSKSGDSSSKTMFVPMPEEKHSTIFHPAALKAFRKVFAIETAKQEE